MRQGAKAKAHRGGKGPTINQHDARDRPLTAAGKTADIAGKTVDYDTLERQQEDPDGKIALSQFVSF